eukprot:3223919-Pleurochrysis_carterae.AAC.1
MKRECQAECTCAIRESRWVGRQRRSAVSDECTMRQCSWNRCGGGRALGVTKEHESSEQRMLRNGRLWR